MTELTPDQQLAEFHDKAWWYIGIDRQPGDPANGWIQHTSAGAEPLLFARYRRLLDHVAKPPRLVPPTDR